MTIYFWKWYVSENGSVNQLFRELQQKFSKTFLISLLKWRHLETILFDIWQRYISGLFIVLSNFRINNSMKFILRFYLEKLRESPFASNWAWS